MVDQEFMSIMLPTSMVPAPQKDLPRQKTSQCVIQGFAWSEQYPEGTFVCPVGRTPCSCTKGAGPAQSMYHSIYVAVTIWILEPQDSERP